MAIQLLSGAVSGGTGNSGSYVFSTGGNSVSADGRYAVIHSDATNLVASDPNGSARDVFLVDLQTGLVQLVSSGGNNASFNAAISPDGRYVVYESSASNLSGADTNGSVKDILLFDRITGITKILCPAPMARARMRPFQQTGALLPLKARPAILSLVT